MTDGRGAGPALDKSLVVVDVGCRWGVADAFVDSAGEVLVYGFDPDREECERLREVYAGHPGVRLVPLALSDHEGTKRLYVTREPGCSSMYEPDERLAELYPALACTQKVDVVDVDVTTLDAWSARNDIEYIDHVKIDTQGSELDVLRGGVEMLKTVRTLEVEVEFNPIYRGQPLFSDIDLFIRDHGFVLWKLTNQVHYGLGGENKIELREDRVHNDQISQSVRLLGGQLYWADAHYVREEIVTAAQGSVEQVQRDMVLLHKLGHLDLISRLSAVLEKL